VEITYKSKKTIKNKYGDITMIHYKMLVDGHETVVPVRPNVGDLETVKKILRWHLDGSWRKEEEAKREKLIALINEMANASKKGGEK